MRYIKFNKIVAGPRFAFHAGQIASVDGKKLTESDADSLIKCGAADPHVVKAKASKHEDRKEPAKQDEKKASAAQ
jgi:hypothetical protein